MSKLQALRERRKDLAKAVRQQADKMNADGYTPTGEDQAAWEKVNADYNTALQTLEREETAARIDTDTNSPDPRNRLPGIGGTTSRRKQKADRAEEASDKDRAVAVGAWARAQMGMGLRKSQKIACRKVGLNPLRSKLTFNLLRSQPLAELQDAMTGVHRKKAKGAGLEYMATLTNTSGTAGGFLIPPLTLSRSLEVNMLAYGGLLQVAETITTSTGERMGWPTADDTTNKGVRLGANTAAGPSSGGVNQGTDPTFGQVYWDAYKYSSKAVLVPYELIEDAIVDVPGVLGEMLGIRLGRILNDECTTGTGNNMPKGVAVAAALGYTCAKANKLGADDFMNLEHSIDPAYRSAPSVGYMMHDKILLAVRLLKDGDGQYLYKSGVNFGAPDTLNGYRININQSMDSTFASGKRVALFGDLRRYKVRRVNGVRMYRLEERYRDTDQDGFLALLRADGNLLTAGTSPVNYLLSS